MLASAEIDEFDRIRLRRKASTPCAVNRRPVPGVARE